MKISTCFNTARLIALPSNESQDYKTAKYYEKFSFYMLTAAANACTDQYVYEKGICHLPDSEDVVFMEHYRDTTEKVCQALCTQLEPEKCFGIFYDVKSQVCSLTSYTQTSGANACRDNSENGLLYFRRHVCLGEYFHTTFTTQWNSIHSSIHGDSIHLKVFSCLKICDSCSGRWPIG